jgi:crossover junction endodeoxyribonuclease RuvC
VNWARLAVKRNHKGCEEAKGSVPVRRCAERAAGAATLPNMRSIRRVLGVDPGLTRCGIGVVDSAGGRLTLIEVDVLRTPSDAQIGARLLALEVGFEAWIARHRPDVVAVERVFSQHNVRTVMGTAQAAAVAITCAARRGIPVALRTPSEVKAAVTGQGRAGKEQVAFMVRKLLAAPGLVAPADATDALALAICEVWRGAASAKVSIALEAAGRRSRPGALAIQAGGSR